MGLFSLQLHIAVHYQRKSGQELITGKNLEAEADAEAMKRCYLLACFPWLAQVFFFFFFFFLRTQDYQPRAYCGQGHPMACFV
jgi:hypothetical protein